ncbi:MAG TPA: hypothetical protein VE978_17995, partial [Chitinophagales bacterium]|nr:hypothetical protein [Chitinophagales bacterium]
TLMIASVSFFLGSCNGQAKPPDSSNYFIQIKEQAEAMAQLLLKKDFKSFAKFTHPKIVEMMGGEQKMIEGMEKDLKEMESQGTGFLNVTIGEPSKVIVVNNELQSTVPQTIEMKVPNGRLVAKSTLIAISTDNGKTWYFIDTSGKDIQAMKKIFPNLSEELVISEKQQPIFYKD